MEIISEPTDEKEEGRAVGCEPRRVPSRKLGSPRPLTLHAQARESVLGMVVKVSAPGGVLLCLEDLGHVVVSVLASIFL